MKKLIIMRHAKSSWAHEGLPDFERPLNKRGRRSAPVMAGRLMYYQHLPDQLLSSSSKRTRETAYLMMDEGLIRSGQCSFLDALYLASSDQIRHIIQTKNLDADCLMILAHNPGVTHFVNEYSHTQLDNLPTAGIAVIEFAVTSWDQLNENTKGELLVLEFPRMFE